ncbi:uncharacterized protein LOC102291672 isoform X1 [Haplochromis burtoni]|uniref:uncharacterized protein LOC102291672 isoform X1 n=1 Tax=Haplochromis burtoni TaxID=8153 RepID=UPI0003BD5F59|nr:uncharacterized protein LOC102291672 isoform X1 [Haplochromis burtoni]
MQPPQEPCPSMTEPPAENSRVHQSPDEAALCWSTDLGHLPEDDEQEEHDPDPPQDQPEVQEVKQGAAADDQEAGGQERKEDRALPPDPDSNLMMGVANQDEAGESGGSVPSPVVTETEQVSPETAHLYSWLHLCWQRSQVALLLHICCFVLSVNGASDQVQSPALLTVSLHQPDTFFCVFKTTFPHFHVPVRRVCAFRAVIMRRVAARPAVDFRRVFSNVFVHRELF